MKTTLLFLSVFLSANLFGQIVYVNNFDNLYIYGSNDWSFDIDSDGIMDIKFVQNGNGPDNKFSGIGNSKVLADLNALAIDCADDTISAFSLHWQNNSYLWKPNNEQFDIGIGNHKQGIRIATINPATEDLWAFMYGYIDYTMLPTRDVIIHGWYYNSAFNQGIIEGELPLVGINELTTTKNLIQILDMMGRETSFKPNTPLIYVYDDGSTEKVFSVDY